MPKTTWKPGTMIYPVPVVLVSCGSRKEGYNIITIAWTGTVCTDPPMCYISVRPSRHSYALIQKSGEYVINLSPRSLASAVDWCGVKSGREVDKFAQTGLTPIPALHVAAPLIDESPLNIECKVREVLPLGSHHMFLADVLAIHAEESLIHPKTGAFRLSRAQLICYAHGGYFPLGRLIGTFGFSVRKRKKMRRGRRQETKG
jgi:flavin reductase (DIM6/NTAB) family NADH-FMN oxidoreductase RutF